MPGKKIAETGPEQGARNRTKEQIKHQHWINGSQSHVQHTSKTGQHHSVHDVGADDERRRKRKEQQKQHHSDRAGTNGSHAYQETSQ